MDVSKKQISAWARELGQLEERLDHLNNIEQFVTPDTPGHAQFLADRAVVRRKILFLRNNLIYYNAL